MSTTARPSPSSRAACPRCGRTVPANAVLGACPACLLAAGFASEPAAPAATPPPPSPAELAPEFPELELIELLGRGGMGAVYKARQRALDRLVALKLLRPGLDADPSFAERFTREARALAQLNHPGIVTLYEFGRTPGGLFFILMEFVDGLNLRQLLAAGRLSPREALAIIPPLCDALQYAHDRGFVHRDIKPENLLIDRLGRVKVADFGLAKLTAKSASPADTKTPSPSVSATGHGSLVTGHSSDGETTAGQVFGTPGYMAPEQREQPSVVDHRADIYALGVVLYQLLTGELPDAKQLQPPSHRVQIDVRLDAIVLRALETTPGRRYSAASELKTQVEHVTRTTAEKEKPASEIASPVPPPPIARDRSPSSQRFPAARRPWYKWKRVPITAGVLLLGLLLHAFVIAPFRLEGSSVEPEIPAGSLVFVYKFDRHFSPGDIVAYQHTESLVYVGRVTAAGPVDGKVSITRKAQPPAPISIDAIIGKVVFNTRPSRSGQPAENFSAKPSDTFRRFPNEPVSIHADGTYAIGASKVTLAELEHHFSKIGQESPGATIHVHAGEKTAYTRTAEIFTAARRMGISKIALQEISSSSSAGAGSVDDVTSQALLWLKPIDAGRFAESWQTASVAFKAATTEAQWTEALNSVRSPLGAVLSRQLQESRQREKIPGAAGGPHVVLRFATRFEKFLPAIETVTFTRDPDGIWRAFAYLIKPDLKAQHSPDPATPVTSPITGAVEKWLQQSDEARYAENWAATSPLFKQAMTETAWTYALKSVRAPLGKVVKRVLIFTQPLDTLAGVPGGPHQLFQFTTAFENEPDAVETVTFTRDTDGEWRASGYFIK
jgi:serine/threonine protein kinase